MKTRGTFLAICLGLASCLLLAETSAAQVGTTRAATRQMQRLITRIETKIEILKDEAERVSTRANRQDATNSAPDELTRNLDALSESVSRLDDAFDARQPVDDEVRDALMEATVIDQFMEQNRVSVSAQSQWRSLKRDFTSLASSNRISWNWDQTVPYDRRPGGRLPSGERAYIVTDTQMETLLSRIELKTDIFKRQMDTALTRTRLSTDARTVSDYIAGFEAATNRLRQRFTSRESTDQDVSDVLLRAAYIDRFMAENNLTAEAEAQWRNLRGDLNALATDYRVSWNWNQTLPPYPGQLPGPGGPVAGRGFDAAITGTFRLNTSQSEDVSTAVDRALTRVTEADRTIQRQRLERRLRSPEMIAIEKNNATITMASSVQPQFTFQADGIARSETNARGRTVTTTATADADGLIINTQGERANDFYVTFAPAADGRLRVTRRIYLENSNDSVTVSSVYDKIDQVARFNMVTVGSDTSAGVINDSFIIPDGTRLNAVLRTSISSMANVNDRVTLEITTPSQYRGALISGRVVTEDVSSRVAGRTRVLLNFDSIRLANGQSYRFGGVVNGVISSSGENIGVSQQTAARQTRAGIGDVLGALIGAISGRPIEQTTAGTPAGTILVQSGNVLNIGEGSQFIITASSDTTVNQPR